MEPRTTEIGGQTFQLMPLPAAQSLRLWAKLVKQHGGQLSKFGDDSDQAIEALCASLDPDLIEEVRAIFAKHCTRDGKSLGDQPWFDATFSGKIGDLMRWLMFCLKSEFSHFFESLAGLGLAMPAGPSSPTE
jgi:hypothetical protein